MKIAIMGRDKTAQLLEEYYSYSAFGLPYTNSYEQHKKLDVLNICLRYDANFRKNVIAEIKKYKPDLTIIYSRIAPNTIAHIRYRTKLPVVYSPIFGINPKAITKKGEDVPLLKIMNSFPRFFGAEKIGDIKKTKEHMTLIGFKRPMDIKPAILVEIYALMMDAYYAHDLLFADYAKQLLKGKDDNFELYQKFIESYNRGYRKMRMLYNNRSSISPVDELGDDLIFATKELDKLIGHNVSKQILKYGKEKSA